jgi:hypothetical protein
MTTTNIPVAPAMGVQGSKSHGGHYLAYRQCPKFDLAASLKLISQVNPWQPQSPGFRFWTEVLAKNPATVGAAIKAAEGMFKAAEVQNHLRWLYTWGGAYLEVGGKLFAAPPVAPKAPKVAKGKTPAKVK